MVSIELTDQDLIVHILGWHKLLALRSSISVPLRHVEEVRARPSEASFDDTIRNPWSGVGTYVRGKMAVGTLDLPDGRAFFDVENPNSTIAIDLVDEPIRHIVVELASETPDAAVSRIQRSLAY